MKKTIIFVILLSLIANVDAQFPCGNGTSTNPNNPSNPQENEWYFQNDHFLNQFDWAAHAQNTIDGWHYENMGDFFGQQSGDFPSPFSIAGVSPDYDYLLDGGTEADYFQQDGWELLYMNLGTYPDGTILAQSELTLTTVPYVILYNKYKGTIRVFGKTTTGLSNSTYKAVEVRIEFKNTNVSGLFGLTNSNTLALDQPTQVTRVVALCNHPNNFQQWFHADFQVAYDPCGCYFKSDLQLHFDFIQSSDISLAGRSISIEQDLYDNSTHTVNYDKNFLTNIFKNDNAEAEAGSIIYKDIEHLLDDYIAKLEAVEAYNNDPKIKRNKQILKLVKGMKAGVVNYLATNPMFSLTMQLVPYVVKGVSFVTQQPYSLEVDSNKLKKELKNVLGQGYDQFTSFLEKKIVPSAPPTPEMPTAIISEMSYSGTVQTTATTGISLLFNPGTFNNNNVYNTQQFSNNEQITTYNYPSYNEVLGTFAMLYTPKTDHYQSAIQGPYTGMDPYLQYLGRERSYEAKFKLNENLKYIFNPVLDLNTSNTKISAAYVVRCETQMMDGQCVSLPIPGPTNYGPGLIIDPILTLYNLELDNTNPSLFPNNQTSNTFEYLSPFVSLDCFADMTIGFKNDYIVADPEFDFNSITGPYEDVSYTIYIKLLIEYEYTQLDHRGGPNKITQILTFKADDLITSTSIPISYNLSPYPENLTISTTNIASSTNYQAWNSITVLGNITENTAVTSNMWAGDYIRIGTESKITPNTGGNIRLSIIPLLNCTSSMPPVDANFVHTFCNSTDYKAKDIDPNSRSVHINSHQNQIELVALAYGSGFLTTSKNQFDEGLVFTITNMSGQILYSSNTFTSFIDMSTYSPGMYLFNLSTVNGTRTQKVIVTNKF